MSIEKCVSQFITAIEVERNLSERTIKAYLSDLGQVEMFFTEKLVREITTDDIKAYLKSLKENSEYADTTIKRKIATLKSFFKYLENEEIIYRAPTRKLNGRYITPKILPKVMRINEIEKVIQVAYNEMYQNTILCHRHNNNKTASMKLLLAYRNVVMIEILFSTGIRIGELVNIDIADLDLNTGSLLIFGKGRKERMLYISTTEVLELIQKYLKLRNMIKSNSNALFLNRFGQRLSIYSVENVFSDLIMKAGIINHYTPHSLRHTMATMLLNNGADIRSVQEILGHATLATTQIYLEVSSKRKKEVLAKYNQRNYMKLQLKKV